MSTIQDLGRIGHQSSGFSPAGSVDYEASALANALLGNSEDKAVIEMTLNGMTLEVLKNTVIATAGADMALQINGQDYPIGRPIYLKKGDLVQFGMAKEGLRTYLAVPGGFVGQEVLGSVSTHYRSGIGGYEGRALEAGDLLDINGSKVTSFPYILKKEKQAVVREIRIIPGPEYDRFNQEARDRLVKDWYVIQNQSDRMGIRLQGPSVSTEDGAHDIISAPTQLGNVQVPKNGQPIILLNDRQSSGGYTRIATVAKLDLLKLAQMRPGERFKFSWIDIDQAQDLYKQKMQDIKNREALYTDRDFQYYRRIEAEKIDQLLKGEAYE